MPMPLLPDPDDPPAGGHHFLDELWGSIRRRLPQPESRRVEPHLLVPVAGRVVRVPIQTVLVHAQVRAAATMDDAVIDVDAVVHLLVIDPARVLVSAAECGDAASATAEASLRAVLGRTDSDTVASDRDYVGADVRAVVDARIGASAAGWGARVDRVEIGDVVLTAGPRRRVAAEWRTADPVPAPGGGHPGAARRADVAEALEEHPDALRLQLSGVVGDHDDTVVVPLRIELIRSLVRRAAPAGPSSGSTPFNGSA